jgi:hypothetical protein
MTLKPAETPLYRPQRVQAVFNVFSKLRGSR